MKLLLVGDLHLTGRTPISRTDDFPETQYKKMNQIVDIAGGDKYILQAGDFFDSYSPSFRVINRYIQLLNSPSLYCFCVMGQHDLYLWSLTGIERTALSILESSNCVDIIRDCYTLDRDHVCKIYGCSWGQEIPKIRDANKFNILVIHKNIGDKPLFHGHDLEHPRRFLNKYGFDLILCGDYHFPFEYSNENRLIINTGTISRKSITEKDIKPSVVLYDTETRKHEWIELKHDSNPFVNREREHKVEGTLDMSDFFFQINSESDITKISFRDNVMRALEAKEVKKEVKEKAIAILNEGY